MSNQMNEQLYLKLCATAKKEAWSFARTVVQSSANFEEVQRFLNSLFYNRSIMENDPFAVYLGLMYEYIGCEMPDDMDCYIIMDQPSNVFFCCFLANLLVAIIKLIGGERPCPVM